MASLFDGIESLEYSSVGAAQVAPVVHAAPMGEAGLFDSCVLLNLTLRCMGVSRKLNDSQYEVDADKKRTTATKKICQSDELDDIHDVVNGVRKWIKARTVPTKIKGGILIMRLQLVPGMYEFIGEQQAILSNLVDKFVAAYPNLKWKDSLPADQGGLGSTYDEKDYPAVDELPDLFEISCVPFEMGAPGKLKAIDHLAYEKAAEACQGELRDAVECAKTLLMDELSKIIDTMHGALVPGPDGKTKVFRDTFVPNVVSFLKNYDFRNFGNPAEITDLVKQMSALLEGVDSKKLRSSSELKASVGAKVVEIKERLMALAVDKPSRMITFDELGDL